MKKSEFIKKVLKSQSNTVFTTEEQVENAIKIFERCGMLPPNLEREKGTSYVDKTTGMTVGFFKWKEE